MARMPGVVWVGEKSPKKAMARYDIACLHTIVGLAPAHAAHFSTSGAGVIYQSRDTRYRSAANLDGNHRIIAIENADHGPEFKKWDADDGHAVPAFTNAQIEAIARILAWAHEVHDIPLVLAPNSKPGSRGIAYHRQGIDGNWSGYRYGGRVSGGEVWTEHRGKVCPGDRRIAQIPQIIARAKQIVAGIATTPPEDDDMQLSEIMNSDAFWEKVGKFATSSPVGGVKGNPSVGTLASQAKTAATKAVAEVGALKAVVAEIAKGQSLTAAQITMASEAGARKAIEELIDSARTELVVEDDGA